MPGDRHPLDRTLFFLDGDTGEARGEFLHPRPQTALENCTWHNVARARKLSHLNPQTQEFTIDLK